MTRRIDDEKATHFVGTAGGNDSKVGRRNLSKYDRSNLALQLEEMYRAEAKKRQQLSQGAGKKGLQNSGNLSESTPMHTDERLAKLAGVSRDTIRKVKVIETEAARGNERPSRALPMTLRTLIRSR